MTHAHRTPPGTAPRGSNTSGHVMIVRAKFGRVDGVTPRPTLGDASVMTRELSWVTVVVGHCGVITVEPGPVVRSPDTRVSFLHARRPHCLARRLLPTRRTPAGDGRTDSNPRRHSSPAPRCSRSLSAHSHPRNASPSERFTLGTLHSRNACSRNAPLSKRSLSEHNPSQTECRAIRTRAQSVRVPC